MLFVICFGIYAAITCLIMPWVNHNRISSLQKEIDSLRWQMKTIPGQPKPEFRTQSASVQVEEPLKYETKSRTPWMVENQYEEITAPVNEEAEEENNKFSNEPEYVPVAEGTEQDIKSVEFNLGAKLPVWIGAVSLACAAFYLVKYSIEAGWVSPVVRIVMGGLFGSGLIAAGQAILRRDWIANHNRISQGLVGAGLVSLYFSVYAATNFYHLLPPFPGFIGMSIVTAMTMILSLRHGQPIAIFGMVGGLITPALMSSSDPHALALFGYLFLLFSFMLVIMARRGWWMMTASAILGSFAWTAFWILNDFHAGDTVILLAFSAALPFAVLAATAKYLVGTVASDQKRVDTDLHGLNILSVACGVGTVLWIGSVAPITLFTWATLGLFSLAILVMAWVKPEIYSKAVWAKLAADLVLLLLWSHHAPLQDALIVLAGMASIYMAIPYVIMRRVIDPREWSGIQVVSALALYGIAYFRIPLMQDIHHGWGMIALCLAALACWQAGAMRLKYLADDTIQNYLVTVYALAATSFISLGMSIELPERYLPLAFAAQTMATMWIYRISGIASLSRMAQTLTLVFVALNYQQIAMFGSLVISSILGQHSFVPVTAASMTAIKLGFPAIFLTAALILYRRGRIEKPEHNILYPDVSGVLLATALCCACGQIYMLARVAFAMLVPDSHSILPVDFLNIPAGFTERGVITAMLTLSGMALLYIAERYDISSIKPFGRFAFHVGMLRVVWFDILLLNPYFHVTQHVGISPLINGVTLVYGGGLLLALWAVTAREFFIFSVRQIYGVLAGLLLFLLVTLNVRQFFHGTILTDGVRTSSELYSYSAVWLLTGLALLAAGIAGRNRLVRFASLVFMALAIGKVFLFDAANLEGLLRVCSFLGLGLSLIGLSFFYTRFIMKSLDE